MRLPASLLNKWSVGVKDLFLGQEKQDQGVSSREEYRVALRGVGKKLPLPYLLWSYGRGLKHVTG